MWESVGPICFCTWNSSIVWFTSLASTIIWISANFFSLQSLSRTALPYLFQKLFLMSRGCPDSPFAKKQLVSLKSSSLSFLLPPIFVSPLGEYDFYMSGFLLVLTMWAKVFHVLLHSNLKWKSGSNIWIFKSKTIKSLKENGG